MKKDYPQYSKIKDGVEPVYKQMPESDKAVLQHFLTDCEGHSATRKVKARRAEILQVYDIIEKPFAQWDDKQVSGFLSVLNNSDRAAWTKKCILMSLSMFLKYTFKKELSERFDNLDNVKKATRGISISNEARYNDNTLPTPEELNALLRAAGDKNFRDALYISLAIEGGLPPKVELTLKWENVKIDYPKPGVSTVTYIRTKNNAEFVCPLLVSTKYLKEWEQHYSFPNRKANDYIFPSPNDRSKPLSSQTAWYLFKRLSKKAGIQKNVYQYLIRHNTLSNSYEKLTEEVHRKVYGHVKGSNMTKVYSHSDNQKALQEALSKLHDVKPVTTKEANEIKTLKKQIEEMQNKFAMFDDLLKGMNKDEKLMVVKVQGEDKPSMFIKVNEKKMKEEASKRKLSDERIKELEELTKRISSLSKKEEDSKK